MKKMKYVFCVFLALVIIFGIIFGSFALVYSFLNSSNDSEYINSPKLGKVTYEFTGESDHFYFDVGKVYISNNDKVILVDIFKQKKKIKRLKSIKIESFLGDAKWMKSEKKVFFNKLDKRIDGVNLYKIEEACYSDNCQHTIFHDVKSGGQFMNDFKLKVTYCLWNDKCKTEDFKIIYQTDED